LRGAKGSSSRSVDRGGIAYPTAFCLCALIKNMKKIKIIRDPAEIMALVKTGTVYAGEYFRPGDEFVPLIAEQGGKYYLFRMKSAGDVIQVLEKKKAKHARSANH